MMNKLKIILLFFSLTATFSCKKDKENLTTETEQKDTLISIEDSSATPIDSSAINKNTFTAETFKMPAEIVGCSCYFAKTKEDLKNRNYIYADDYGNKAFIKINNQLISIPMEEGDFDPSNFKKTIENKDYRVSITGKKMEEMEEVMMFQGLMTVEKYSTKEKFTTPIFGECGC